MDLTICRSMSGMASAIRMRVTGAIVLALALAACDMSAIQRGFGLPADEEIARAEATTEYAIVPATRSFLNVPNAHLVLERDLGIAVDQRILLPNATTSAGENVILARAQTRGSASSAALRLTEAVERFGGLPEPFASISEGDLRVQQDDFGSFVYASRTQGDSVTCVLALRRTPVGARPLPRGSSGLDVMLRNCVPGDVRSALAPIGAGAFRLGASVLPLSE